MISHVFRHLQERISVKDVDIHLPPKKRKALNREIMSQERVQIGSVEQTVDAPTHQTQVEKAEVVRRTSESTVEQTIECLVSCQERTQRANWVRPHAYVNRRR